MTCRLTDFDLPLDVICGRLAAISGRFHNSDRETEPTGQSFGSKSSTCWRLGVTFDLPGTTISENGPYAIRSRLCCPNVVPVVPV